MLLMTKTDHRKAVKLGFGLTWRNRRYVRGRDGLWRPIDTRFIVNSCETNVGDFQP